ncbi:MAG: hypothetical protein KF832_26595 [Caldilineaceae bacterium]|nr:hypothetical protein [Caldilineaceae bacterium]
MILLSDDGTLGSHKLPSTPPHFEEAVLQGIDHLLRVADLSGPAITAVAHGTTVATNAVLEDRGAPTALITTKCFRDVLELRRIRAPQLYALFFDKPAPLVERHLRFEVSERMAANPTMNSIGAPWATIWRGWTRASPRSMSLRWCPMVTCGWP